jgi:hypothetical protein
MVILRVSADSNYILHFTINNGSNVPVLISKENFEIVCNPKIEKNYAYCELLKSTLEKEISKHFTQWFSFKSVKSIEIKPMQPYSFSISLAKLADHPYFDEQNHCFTITTKIKIDEQASPIEAVLDLTWYPFKVTQIGENEIDLIINNLSSQSEDSNRDKLTMLEYRDTQPFYLNVAESSTLKLWITGADQNTWINHADSPPKLEATPTVEFINPEMSPDLSQRLARQFKVNEVKLTKKDSDTLMILPIDNPKDSISLDSPTSLRITLTPSSNQKPLSCEIAVLLQRPAFPGHVALDFGTTNSAVAYYDPNAGIPEFPDRRFSDSQLNKLNSVIHQLMDEVDKQALKEPTYQEAAQQLVHFARMMWTTDPQGNQVESISDIKQHFVRLQHRDMEKKPIGEWQAKLLVSWGVIGYNTLKNNRTPLVVLNFVAQQYFKALNHIIDIDLKADAKLGLPELDPGQRSGAIPSDIKMLQLNALGDTKQIDGLHSNIDMGEAVKSNLSTYADSPGELPELPQDGKEKHKLYLSSAKRGLGLKETSYFIDGENQVFVDTYDPLCTAAIKELFTRTEQYINDRRNCLNNAVVTYPANLPQYRRESYRKIMQSLGVSHIDMSFDEATAGALYYVWRELFKDLFAGIDGFLARSRTQKQQSVHPLTGQSREVNFYYQNILLYDLGGGTTDIALLEIGLEEIENLLPSSQRNSGRYFIIRPKILGLTGREDFGGDNVTLAVFRILKSKLASTAAQLLSDKLKAEGRRNEYPATVQEALDAFELHHSKTETDIFTKWFAEEGDKKYENKVAISESADGTQTKTRELPDLIDALVTTRFDSKPELQPVFFGLWQEAERIKKVFSTHQQGYEDSPLPDTATASPQKLLPAIAHLDLGISEMDLGNVSITASEMERLIKKDIAQTFEKARNLCVEGNKEVGYTTKYFINRLVLAGSGSHLRLIREEMPHQILSQPFTFEKGGRNYTLSAPFKHDGYNLEFTPEDAKLAVVRGASLPRYFKTTRVPPQSPKMMSLLKDGVNFLDFDVDNLRNYMPFTLIYAVGHATDILFESGQQMREISRSGKAAIRKRIPEGDTINCYRVDNVIQMGNANEEQYYAQFSIRDAFIQFYANLTGEELTKDRDQEKLDRLMSQYLFWAEFDIERDIKCFMYTKPEGNDDSRYINQTATVIEQERISEAIEALVNRQDRQWTFKSDISLWCPAGVGGQETVELKLSESKTVAYGNVGFRQTINNDGGNTLFALSPESKPLWQVNLPNYSVNNKSVWLQPELHIQLELEGEQLQLKYTVYDPDLAGENVREIEMSYDSRKTKPPFNPYRGEE